MHRAGELSHQFYILIIVLAHRARESSSISEVQPAKAGARQGLPFTELPYLRAPR